MGFGTGLTWKSKIFSLFILSQLAIAPHSFAKDSASDDSSADPEITSAKSDLSDAQQKLKQCTDELKQIQNQNSPYKGSCTGCAISANNCTERDFTQAQANSDTATQADTTALIAQAKVAGAGQNFCQNLYEADKTFDSDSLLSTDCVKAIKRCHTVEDAQAVDRDTKCKKEENEEIAQDQAKIKSLQSQQSTDQASQSKYPGCPVCDMYAKIYGRTPSVGEDIVNGLSAITPMVLGGLNTYMGSKALNAYGGWYNNYVNANLQEGLPVNQAPLGITSGFGGFGMMGGAGYGMGTIASGYGLLGGLNMVGGGGMGYPVMMGGGMGMPGMGMSGMGMMGSFLGVSGITGGMGGYPGMMGYPGMGMMGISGMGMMGSFSGYPMGLSTGAISGYPGISGMGMMGISGMGYLGSFSGYPGMLGASGIIGAMSGYPGMGYMGGMGSFAGGLGYLGNSYPVPISAGGFGMPASPFGTGYSPGLFPYGPVGGAAFLGGGGIYGGGSFIGGGGGFIGGGYGSPYGGSPYGYPVMGGVGGGYPVGYGASPYGGSPYFGGANPLGGNPYAALGGSPYGPITGLGSSYGFPGGMGCGSGFGCGGIGNLNSGGLGYYPGSGGYFPGAGNTQYMGLLNSSYAMSQLNAARQAQSSQDVGIAQQQLYTANLRYYQNTAYSSNPGTMYGGGYIGGAFGFGNYGGSYTGYTGTAGTGGF